jgi:hypothetical protein
MAIRRNVCTGERVVLGRCHRGSWPSPIGTERTWRRGRRTRWRCACAVQRRQRAERRRVRGITGSSRRRRHRGWWWKRQAARDIRRRADRLAALQLQRTQRGWRRKLRWRQRGSFDRPEKMVVGGDPVIGRHALGYQIGIKRIGTEDVLAHHHRLKRLVAVADFDGRRAFPGVSHAGVVTRTADRERRILRQFAVQPVWSVHRRGVGRGCPEFRGTSAAVR